MFREKLQYSPKTKSFVSFAKVLSQSFFIICTPMHPHISWETAEIMSKCTASVCRICTTNTGRHYIYMLVADLHNTDTQLYEVFRWLTSIRSADPDEIANYIDRTIRVMKNPNTSIDFHNRIEEIITNLMKL